MCFGGSTVVCAILHCADMRFVRTVLLSWWICTSAAVVQNGAENESSLSERRHLRSRYGRPHVERIWIVRPIDSIKQNIRLAANCTDPVGSFAVAIRDPETFLRYLRHEENQRLGKQTGTSYNYMLPSSRHIQLQALSQSESKEKSPIFNIIMEQDDKMTMESFMDLVYQVSSLPSYNEQRSKYNYEDMSIYKLDKQHKATLTQPYMQRTNEPNGNNVYNQRPPGRNTNPEAARDVQPKGSELETEQSWKRQSLRKTDRKNVERHYRQRDGVVEPMLIIGEFGKRTPNYSRPSTHLFNRPQSHDISMSPSLHLVPPVFSAIGHVDRPQNFQNSAETPFSRTDDANASRKRKKLPIARNSRRPVDVGSSSTDNSQSSMHTLLVRNETSTLPANVSLLSADIPQLSTDIPRQSTDNDISHVHISIPRIYTSVSRPHTDVSAPPFTDISRVHIAISRKPLSPTFSSASSRLTNKVGIDDLSPPNASELSPEATTASYKSTESSQPDDSFRLSVNILPPSVDILPPLLSTFAENCTTNEKSGDPEESQDDEVYIGNKPTDSSFQNEESSDFVEAVVQDHTASSPQQSSHPVSRNIKTAQQDRNDGGDAKRQPVSGHSDYGELQLTAAETAYYRSRQLRKPSMILEIAEETGSIPGVPGRDYPIYSRPPKTNFACVKGHGGYYADISTRCQVFYVCTDEGRGEPMLCPNGTLFHQDFLVCDWWFNVACGRVP